jgi:hypothetical protein
MIYDNIVGRWVFTDYGAALWAEMLNRVNKLEAENKLLIQAVVNHENKIKNSVLMQKITQ